MQRTPVKSVKRNRSKRGGLAEQTSNHQSPHPPHETETEPPCKTRFDSVPFPSLADVFPPASTAKPPATSTTTKKTPRLTKISHGINFFAEDDSSDEDYTPVNPKENLNPATRMPDTPSPVGNVTAAVQHDRSLVDAPTPQHMQGDTTEMIGQWERRTRAINHLESSVRNKKEKLAEMSRELERMQKRRDELRQEIEDEEETVAELKRIGSGR